MKTNYIIKVSFFVFIFSLLFVSCDGKSEKNMVLNADRTTKNIVKEKTYCGIAWKKETLDNFGLSISVPYNYYIIHYGYGATLKSFKAINTFYSEGFNGKISSVSEFEREKYGEDNDSIHIYSYQDDINFGHYIETKNDEKLYPKEIMYEGKKFIEVYDNSKKYIKSFYKMKGKKNLLFVFNKSNKTQSDIIKSINNPDFQEILLEKKDCHRETHIWKNEKYNFSIEYPIGYVKNGDFEIPKNSYSKFPNVRLKNIEHHFAIDFEVDTFFSKQKKPNIPESRWKEKDIFIFYDTANISDPRTEFVIRKENGQIYKDFVDKTGKYVFSRYEFHGVTFDFNKGFPNSVEIIKSITTLN